MKNLLSLLLLSISLFFSGQTTQKDSLSTSKPEFEIKTVDSVVDSIKQAQNKIENPIYDAELAKKTKADDYGMKGYFLVILKTGKNNTRDNQFINDTFVKHMENINTLVKQGKLVVSGPFGQNKNQFRGLFILQNINSIEEAEALLLTDSAVKNELLSAEIYPWYGSAALQEYLPISDKIWKKNP